MSDELAHRFLGVFSTGLDPVTTDLLVGAAVVLIISGVIIAALPRGRVSPGLLVELRRRWATWIVIAAACFGAVLTGAAATALLVAAISLLGFREFARGTGLFRERMISVVFVVSVFALAFGALDNRFAQFTAVAPISLIIIVVTRLFRDEPAGYLQSVSLGVIAVLMLAVGPAYLTMFTIDADAGPILLMLFSAAAVGDVSAFLFGRLIGGPKLAPNTSPGKTVSGAAGSLVVTSLFVAYVAGRIYRGTPLDSPGLLVTFGLLVAACGQLGDLVLSSIKRDIGIKDFGHALPGHGGLLDRVDSLLLSAPAAFYFIAYFVGVGIGSTERVLTG
ncbi:MAG: phosphatidate cytidylyltransferase [Phycisphaerales bacterium]|nr:phosphatidate cytidylyltransferase [Phycisphaerales bacterium]